MIQNTLTSKARRQHRVRAKLLAKNTKARLTVHRSNKNIKTQIIDLSGKVLVSATSLSIKDWKGTKTEQAAKVGLDLGQKAKEAKVSEVVFDRGSYRFHGRVKALAEAVRQSGIKF